MASNQKQKLRRLQKEIYNYLYILSYQFSFLDLKIEFLIDPSICKENKIIIIPAAILNSFDKNNNIFPIVDAVIPRAIKTKEKPNENKIVLYNTIDLSCEISLKFSSNIRNIPWNNW